jgi:hypothetical protein
VTATGAVFVTEPAAIWRVAAIEDVDGDGKSDLVWQNSRTGDVQRQLMNGTAGGTRTTIWNVSPDLRVTSASTTTAVQKAARNDFSGDGKSDVIWRNGAGQIALWEFDGTALASTTVAGTLSDANYKVVGAGDVNGTGRSELILRHETGGSMAWWEMNNGAVSSTRVVAVLNDLNWRVQAVDDFDGDGTADILFRHMGTGSIALWTMSGGNALSSQLLGTVADTNWQIQGSGDFYGHGKADVFWRNVSTGNAILWEIDTSSSTFTLQAGSTQINWPLSFAVQQVGDVTGDGIADIVFRNTSTNEIVLDEMDGGTIVSEGAIGTLSDTAWRVQATGGDFTGDG